MAFDTQRKRFESAKQQPGIEWCKGRALGVLDKCDLLTGWDFAPHLDGQSNWRPATLVRADSSFVWWNGSEGVVWHIKVPQIAVEFPTLQFKVTARIERPKETAPTKPAAPKP